MSITDQQRPVWNRGAESYADSFDGQVTQSIGPMLDGARVSRGTRLLDIATGPGILVSGALERGAIVTGVDFAEDMITVAQRTHPDAEFHVADAAHLPFEGGTFDAATMGLALFLLERPSDALREARRVLRPGGRIALSLWDWPVPGFDIFYEVMPSYLPEQADGENPPLMGISDRDSLCQVLVDAGFADVEIEPLPIVWEIDSPDRHFDALASLRDLSGLADEEITRFRADVAERAGAYKRGDRYLIPFPALLMTGARHGNSE